MEKRRIETLMVKLTPAEKQAIKECAEERGWSMAHLTRETLKAEVRREQEARRDVRRERRS